MDTVRYLGSTMYECRILSRAHWYSQIQFRKYINAKNEAETNGEGWRWSLSLNHPNPFVVSASHSAFTGCCGGNSTAHSAHEVVCDGQTMGRSVFYPPQKNLVPKRCRWELVGLICLDRTKNLNSDKVASPPTAPTRLESCMTSCLALKLYVQYLKSGLRWCEWNPYILRVIRKFTYGWIWSIIIRRTWV